MEIDHSSWRRHIEQALPEETKKLIVDQMKVKHYKRYSPVNGKQRKTYDCEDLWDDLMFILNHLHIPETTTKKPTKMENQKTDCIDCTPKWEGLLPLMLDIMQNPSTSDVVKETIKEEFKRMAQAADKYNEIAKSLNC